MPIRFRCSHCRQLHAIATRMAGQFVACPSCGEQTQVPQPDTVAEPPAERPSAAAPDPQFRQEQEAGSDQSAAPTGEEQATRAASEFWAADRGAGDVQAENPWFQTEQVTDDEEFQLRRFASEFDDLDLTPMVDVTFLLLIFFIITASFDLQKTLEIPPPNPDQKGAVQSMTLEQFEDNSIIVHVDERNVISIDYDPLPDPSRLVGALRDKKILDRKNEILIDAHADALHETVVTVIDAANEVGMEKIRLASNSSAGS